MTTTGTAFRRMSSAVLGAGLLFIGACKDNPAKPIEGAGDPENISRVTITLVPVGGGTTVTSVIVDPDGTQLPLPIGTAQGTLALVKGKTYTGTIAMLNDLDSKNVIDISGEVQKEANFHRFFFTFSCTGVTAPVSGMDKDTQATPQPVGLTFQVVVDATAPSSTNCTLHVELHHFEAAKGDGTGTTFDTDLSVNFPVSIS